MDISLMSRDEKLLRRLLGESIEIEDPQSRIEFLLKQIIDAGGIGGGSYKIRDQYDTVEELEAAHPTSDPGDAYLVGDPTHIYIWLTDEQKYADGGLFTSVPGLDGVGITSIDKTSTVGLVDTYTITYTDGDTDTFTVTNGAPGEPGYDGVGIESIEKTSTVGLVDTYTITLTDGTTYDFTVTNGSGGSGVPEGGTTGQVLAKKSDADGDVEWINQSGGSDVSSEIESLSAAASELASENAVQTSEIGSLASELESMSVSDISSELESLSNQASEHTSEIASLASEMESMSVSDISSELASLSTEASEHESEINSLSIENSTQTSELAAHSQSLSEIASAASSTSIAQSQYDSTQDSHLASLSAENSTQTSELASLSTAESEMASEMETMGSELNEKQPMLTEGTGIDIDDNNVISVDPQIYTDTPIGAIVPYGGNTAPSGFLICDGSAVSRTTYSDLYAVIGTKYGPGDGSTTFNLPDGVSGAELYPVGDAEIGISGSMYIIKAKRTLLPVDFQSALDEKQDIVDDTLETTSKEITGAINELNTEKVKISHAGVGLISGAIEHPTAGVFAIIFDINGTNMSLLQFDNQNIQNYRSADGGTTWTLVWSK